MWLWLHIGCIAAQMYIVQAALKQTPCLVALANVSLCILVKLPWNGETEWTVL